MTTLIPGGIPPSSSINLLNIAELKNVINAIRKENNADFLDDSEILMYINFAIDELNAKDDFKNRESYTEYAIDTTISRFYLFSTLFGAETPFERIKSIRLKGDLSLSGPLEFGKDYIYEPDPEGQGQGIRFTTNIQNALEFIYFTYIPRVTSNADYVQVSHLANPFFINKVLQKVYQSEGKLDQVRFYKEEAAEALSDLLGNNNYQEDEVLATNPNWL